MADSLSTADPLDGVCGIVECGDNACIICHTHVGLASDDDGSSINHNGVGVLRIDDRLRGIEHTDKVIHEWLHERLSEWDEEPVKLFAKQLAALLHLPEVKRRSFS